MSCLRPHAGPWKLTAAYDAMIHAPTTGERRELADDFAGVTRAVPGLRPWPASPAVPGSTQTG